MNWRADNCKNWKPLFKDGNKISIYGDCNAPIPSILEHKIERWKMQVRMDTECGKTCPFFEPKKTKK